jgi:hypothetical protein
MKAPALGKIAMNRFLVRSLVRSLVHLLHGQPNVIISFL